LDRKDLEPLKEFCRRAGISASRIVFKNPVALIRSIQTCDALIGVRLHSAVLAACAGVPPVLIGYRDKCLDFMLSMDLESLHIPLSEETIGTLRERIEEKLDSIERLRTVGSFIHDRARHWAKVQKMFVDRMVDL